MNIGELLMWAAQVRAGAFVWAFLPLSYWTAVTEGLVRRSRHDRHR